MDAQLAAASRFTDWPAVNTASDPLRDIAFGPRHDALDAYLAAWVAALDEHQRLAMGSPPDDVIWVPKLEGLATFDGWRAPETVECSPSLAFAKPKRAQPTGKQ